MKDQVLHQGVMGWQSIWDFRNSRMKKYRIIVRYTFLTIILACYSGCEDELESRYQNPDHANNISLGTFFTGILNNNRVRPSYWDVSTFINWHIGVYTQSVGFLNTESVYQQNDSYITDRWDDYYRPGANGSGVLANYREMQNIFSNLSEDKKRQQEVFLQASKLILYDQTSQMIDLWGDIPFTEAGMLNKTGKVIYPVFDDAAKVYSDMLEDLENVSQYFATANLSISSATEFKKQDILLAGDIQRWRCYANALRLRLLIRISFVNEELASQQVLKMLTNPVEYPLPGDDNLYDPVKDDILLQPLTDNRDDLHNAFADWTNYPAPYFLVEEVLKPANDPRLKVCFDKYGKQAGNTFQPNADYHGMPQLLSKIQQEQNLQNYSIVDSSTFLFNAKLPGIIMTVAEVNFLKAEAFERWGGGNAEEAFQNGISQSIDFYYYLNGLNNINKVPVLISDSAKLVFLQTPQVQYTGTSQERLIKIWTQKWAHFGFLQAEESWAEIRRTGYPVLTFRPSTLTGYELPPNRLIYPIKEKTLNENYGAVSYKDQRDVKIFWDVR
jgi:hypothetical protein